MHGANLYKLEKWGIIVAVLSGAAVLVPTSWGFTNLLANVALVNSIFYAAFAIRIGKKPNHYDGDPE